jgi:hypothetical protein
LADFVRKDASNSVLEHGMCASFPLLHSKLVIMNAKKSEIKGISQKKYPRAERKYFLFQRSRFFFFHLSHQHSNQHINTSTHQHITTSTHPRINTSPHPRINTVINTSTPEDIKTLSTHRHNVINTSTNTCSTHHINTATQPSTQTH